jgi:hypothetical protein
VKIENAGKKTWKTKKEVDIAIMKQEKAHLL